MSTTSEGRLLSAGEVARILGVSPTRVGQLAVKGEIAYINSGAGRLFRPSDIAVLAEHRRKMARENRRWTAPPDLTPAA